MATDGTRISRPNSLLLDGIQPEREPLRFDVNLVGAPPEVEQLVNNIKQVAEDFLYHWKTFPIVLPTSRFSPGARPSDLIVAPPCDELDAAALDAGLEPHPLSHKQLHSILEKGEFEVPSRHFPGLTHVWRVAPWLQRGRQHCRESLQCHLAHAAALIVIVARDRLLRDEPCSVPAAVGSLAIGVHRLLDLLIGMPSLEARDLDKKIREERSRYLVAELICKPENQEDIATLAAWVMRSLRRAASEKSDAREPPRIIPPVPCLYTTPQKIQIDLRLYRRDLLRKAAPTLQSILDRESRGWFLHYRERLAAELASQKMPPKDIEEEVIERGASEYARRVSTRVLQRESLRALGDHVPTLLHDQLRATHILTRAEEGVRRKLEDRLARTEARLKTSHPVLSRAPAWHREQLKIAKQKIKDELRWTAMEDAAAAMQAQNLHQHRYFLLRDLVFLRDREPLLVKELRAAKAPTREFQWSTRIWLPQNWIITRHFRGRSERIPVVLSTRATSIVTPRSDPSQPVFLVDKERVRTTTTRWPFWRLVNFANRSWSWCWNLMFLLIVLVPWCSPLSLRTLIQQEPFVPDWELSQINGTLFPKRSSETQTMWSRLLALWRHVSKERTRFETEPDTGLLGKGLSRQANRFWNYGLIGIIGSLTLLLLFPICVLVTCALSTLIGLAVPLWAPPLAAIMHIVNAVVYDFDCPDEKRLCRWFALFEVLIWRLGVLGILQPIAALVTVLVICPVGAFLIFIGGMGWYGLRRGWEWAVFRLVIRHSARVPAHDSAFCARAAGSGQRALYQLTPPQALAAVCARAELDALTSWAQDMEAHIEKPLRDYRHFVDACFGPFSVQIAKTGSYKQLEKECSELTTSLREKVSARKRDLALGLPQSVLSRIRLTPQDLRRTIQACARELSSGGGGGSGDEEWWSARGLDPGAWHALAANMLVEIFDTDILIGVEDKVVIPLESRPHPEEETRWHALCAQPAPDVIGDWGDVAGVSWWGATALPLVRAPPVLELGAFSPRAPPHPPLPPRAIAPLVLYNREADTPVPLESELCAEILKSLEDAPDCDDRRGVGRYRGGSSEAGSSEDEEPRCEEPVSKVTACAERAACRWTLTGRGVRLRADLASPEDVTLDAERAHMGTSV